MATEQDQETELAPEPDAQDLLKFKLKKTQRLLIVTLAVAVISLLLASGQLALYVLADQAASEAESELVVQAAQHSQQLLDMQVKLTALGDNVTQLGARLNNQAVQLNGIDINDPDNAILRIQRILVRQERDYRDFLTNLEQGLYDIHMMVPHSRGWWDSYKEALAETVSLSQARENYIINLREN